MKVLVVGSGGREHALCWAIAQSPLCEALYCAPGNAGIAAVATCVPIGSEDLPNLVAWAKQNAVDLVVVGPEGPLVLGLVDALNAAGIKAFGPKAGAAALEGSKGFMKDVLRDAGVPTAWYGRFTDIDQAKAFVREKGGPIVVKTDGLAAGKGVILCQTVAEAEVALDEMMGDKVFGDAGNEVVIEEFLLGEEASFFAIADGETAIPLVAAQDHKAVGDGDTGPNTGGMGAYSPAPVFTDAVRDLVMETCILPTVRHMKAIGHPYTGVLFCGLMISDAGVKVLEYNVRFGDPECQVLMMRLDGDFLAALLAAAEGRLSDISLRWHDDTAMVVVMAAKGYPGHYEKGSVIGGLDQAAKVEGALVFHAGTKPGADGAVLANGGRVLGVAARGSSVRQAQNRAYQAVDALDWADGFCRRDIGWRALAREESAEN
jgi:phosphoribosylamine--glycine ligase